MQRAVHIVSASMRNFPVRDETWHPFLYLQSLSVDGLAHVVEFIFMSNAVLLLRPL